MALSIDGKSLESLGSADLHLMPCTIEANDEAGVSQYFTPAVREDEQGVGTKGLYSAKVVNNQAKYIVS